MKVVRKKTEMDRRNEHRNVLDEAQMMIRHQLILRDLMITELNATSIFITGHDQSTRACVCIGVQLLTLNRDIRLDSFVAMSRDQFPTSTLHKQANNTANQRAANKPNERTNLNASRRRWTVSSLQSDPLASFLLLTLKWISKTWIFLLFYWKFIMNSFIHD